MYFSPFSITITSLGEERANLSAFRTFVRFALVFLFFFFFIFLFPLPLGVWEGLRFVIVALPGLFSYLFVQKKSRHEPWFDYITAKGDLDIRCSHVAIKGNFSHAVLTWELSCISINVNLFSPAGNYRYLCKQCKSRWDAPSHQNLHYYTAIVFYLRFKPLTLSVDMSKF